MGWCTQEEHARVSTQKLQPFNLQLPLFCSQQPERNGIQRAWQMECGELSSPDVLQRHLGEQNNGSKIFVAVYGGCLPRASIWRFQFPHLLGFFCCHSCWLVYPWYLLLQESYSVVTVIFWHVFCICNIWRYLKLKYSCVLRFSCLNSLTGVMLCVSLCFSFYFFCFFWLWWNDAPLSCIHISVNRSSSVVAFHKNKNHSFKSPRLYLLSCEGRFPQPDAAGTSPWRRPEGCQARNPPVRA